MRTTERSRATRAGAHSLFPARLVPTRPSLPDKEVTPGSSSPRLRRHPNDRFAGAVLAVDLAQAATALRGETHASRSGHRQIALLRKGPVRMVLYAFDAGGRLEAHHAPGYVLLQALRGTFYIQVGENRHALSAGHVLALDPDVEHDVEAVGDAELLLIVSLVGEDKP
jgi:quercetin dioxygenase-like cupin family protein